MIRSISQRSLKLGLALSIASSAAFAQERPLTTVAPAINPKNIDSAVSLFLTSKGEQSLSANLEEILAQNGFSLRTGYFPELTYKAEKPIALEALAKSNPKATEMVKSIRSMLSEWFVGLTIKDPQPIIVAKNAGYRLGLKSLKLSADRAAMAKLGRKSGIVVALEAEIDSFELGAESIMATDPRNAYLGQIGILQPVLSLVPGQKALHLRVPIYLDVTPKGVAFQIIELDTNFAGATFALNNGALVVPDVSIVVNGQTFPLDKQRLVKAFDEMKPQLVAQIKATLDETLQQSFLKVANDEIQKKIPAKLGQVARLKPSGGLDGDPRMTPDFIWGMTVRKLGMGKDVIAIELDSYVEDPMNPNVAPNKDASHRGAVSLAGANPATFDLGLAISRGLINRIIQLSAKRGFFADVESKPGEKLKVLQPPMIDAYQPTAGKDSKNPKLTIKTSLSSPAKGVLQKIMLKKEVKFTVDTIGQFVQLPGAKGLQIQLIDFDYASLYVWPESLTGLGQLFRSQVVKGVREELKKAADEWKKKANILEGEMPLPPELFGQKLSIQTMRMDKNGYIVMFLNFEGAKP
ncbi:MAG: hypothetical protein V4760_17665 [Bdellovibrionota bacterium]